ncbi:hypothetical protein PIB30_092712 [Stylosanthes scabra]|uniref:Transposase, Ptta/En/Spm, plant n=1 Tax=Stylosanthes scabra TaxID=79078 RepID=A0ABU6SVC0_9FABA|nr:hypothetical protein [Stylosanthes scabra]
MKEKSAKEKNYSFEVTQVKSSAELLKLYNIKIEKTNAENNKASFQAQGRKGPTGNQPITIEEEEPVGPTKKVVSNLRAFVGTVVRNPQWVTLLYTSWHGVPNKDKEDMWNYINQKFILLIESKKWVMQALCHAWKKYKGEVKQNHFMKYKTMKQMLKNQPLEIPEAMSAKNIENRSKQTCPHQTGSTGFGIVRKQLRDSKENKEELSRAEIFIVTRTSRKGKEIDPKSQSTIGEYDEKVSSLERQMEGVCGLLTVILQQMNHGKSEEDIAALVQAVRNSPLDASSRPKNTPHSSEATHFPPNVEVRN